MQEESTIKSNNTFVVYVIFFLFAVDQHTYAHGETWDGKQRLECIF